MNKFHINSKGVPAPCKAIKGNCPYGSVDNHYNSEQEAQEAIDKTNEEKYGLLSKSKNVNELINSLGYERTLDNFANSFSLQHMKELNEDLAKDYGIEDLIDESNEEKKFSQIRRFVSDKILLNDLSDRMSTFDLNRAIEFTENTCKPELEDYRKRKNNYSRIDEWSNSFTDEEIVDKFERVIPNKRMKKIIDETIKYYGFESYIDEDNSVPSLFKQTRKLIGDPVMLLNIKSRLSTENLDKYVTDIENTHKKH